MANDKSLSFFFLIGPMKSGTTLFTRVVDQHPDIACLVESKILRPDSESSILCLKANKWKIHGFDETTISTALKLWNTPQLRFTRWLRNSSNRDWNFLHKRLMVKYYKSCMTMLLTDFAKRNDARVVGDKTPDYIDNIEILRSAFPQAKFIYNVRDPRGIWNSARKVKNLDPFEHLETVINYDQIIEQYQNHSNFLTVRYEDLLTVPDVTIKKLYEFLSCDFKKDFSVYNENNDKYPERWYWIPESRSPFMPANATKWMKEINDEDIIRITRLSRSYIKKYGYPL